MRIVRGLFLVALGAGVAVAAGGLLPRDESSRTDGELPPVAGREPRSPEDPPVVWLSGEVREVTASRLVVRSGRGPQIRLWRLGEGATTFLTPGDGRWETLRPAEAERLGPGRTACVESVLDRRRFLALRVFLDTGCGPTGPAPGR